MKNTLLISLSLCFGSLVMAQNANKTNTQKAPADLPYSYGFETDDLDGWIVTNEGKGNIWEKQQGSIDYPDASEGTFYMLYEFNSDEAANTYLYSKGINLKAGKELTLEFDYQGINPAFPEKLEVKIGTAPTVVAQTQQLFINDDIGNYPYETATVNFTVPTDGIYYLSFRAFSDPDQFFLAVDNVKVFETPLATSEAKTSTLKFYPNPVKDVLTISDKTELKDFKIFDISGKQVASQTVKSTKAAINVSKLEPGIYILKANYDGAEKTFKFIKK